MLDALDYREKNGYERHSIKILLGRSERLSARPEIECIETPALTYLAPPGNHAFLGEAPMAKILAQVRRSVGPSGTNLDYVKCLAQSVSALGGKDPHVEAVRIALQSS